MRIRRKDVDARPCKRCGKVDHVVCILGEVIEKPSGLFENQIECRCSECDFSWLEQSIGPPLR